MISDVVTARDIGEVMIKSISPAISDPRRWASDIHRDVREESETQTILFSKLASVSPCLAIHNFPIKIMKNK